MLAVSWTVIAAGSVVLFGGWLLGVDLLTRAVPGQPQMQPVTAAAFVLLAVALQSCLPGTGWLSRRIAVICTGAVVTVGVLTLLEYVFGVDLLVDRLVLPETLDAAPSEYPGRMAAATAVGLVLTAAAQIATRSGTARAVMTGQAIAVGVAVLAVTDVLSGALDVSYQPQAQAATAGGAGGLLTSAGLTALALGTLALRPGIGLTEVITTSNVGGGLGRRLLATALLAPFVLLWLPALIAELGGYGSRLALVFVAAGNAVLLTVVSLAVARTANQLSAARNQAEQEARVGHEQLLALVDNTSAVIYMRDIDGRYILVNRQYERLFEVKREKIAGLTDFDLFPREVAEEFRANDMEAIAAGRPLHVEEIAPGEDGPHTYITVKFPLVNETGQAYAVCGISTDITPRKRAEEEVRRLNADLERRVRERTAELEASTRELDAFAYSVSHDLRAPLRSINGYSEVLSEDYGENLDQTGRDYLMRLQANVERMAQMIDDLLNLSRATRVELHREPVDVAAIAHDVVAELREAESDRPVTAKIGDSLTAAGDPRLIRLVLYNLLSNAWKFTSKRANPVVEVGCIEEQHECVFFIRDNGAGFNMRYAGKLFDPFQRLHSKSEFDGSGVGLAIVQRVVRRHGGRIWAEDEPDRGATFYFTLTPELETVHERRRDPVGRGQSR